MFEISFVDHDDPFYQLQNLPVYKMRCRTFEYSHEDMATGVTEIDEIDLLVNKARFAQQKFERNGSQELFDLACQAVGWALMKPEQNKKLAELAVKETGLGNVQDKLKRND